MKFDLYKFLIFLFYLQKNFIIDINFPKIFFGNIFCVRKNFFFVFWDGSINVIVYSKTSENVILHLTYLDNAQVSRTENWENAGLLQKDNDESSSSPRKNYLILRSQKLLKNDRNTGIYIRRHFCGAVGVSSAIIMSSCHHEWHDDMMTWGHDDMTAHWKCFWHSKHPRKSFEHIIDLHDFS